MKYVRCGNTPGARERMTDLDRAWIDWFGAYLAWSKSDPETRGDAPPEPTPADYAGKESMRVAP